MAENKVHTIETPAVEVGLHDSPPSPAPMTALVSPAVLKRKIARRLAQRHAAGDGISAGAAEAVEHAASSTGMPLPSPLQPRFESSLGADLGDVRIHTGEASAVAAASVAARAYTTGQDIHFGHGQYDPSSRSGQELLAHEVAHTIQQSRGGGGGGAQLKLEVSSPGDVEEQEADRAAVAMVEGAPATVGTASGVSRQTLFRYEAGEHQMTGETQRELQQACAPIQYTVAKDETPDVIADKFNIGVAELKAANKGKIKTWPAKNGSGKEIEGFAAGEKIAIPQNLNDMAKDAVKDKSIKVAVNGAVLDYGSLIAMGGDMFGSADELASTPPEELKKIAALIDEERATGKAVSTPRWQEATKGRFLKLAERNEAHFAPSDSGLVKPSGVASQDHKSTWEQHHRKALEASQAGKKDQALLLNAFGDHFLTDAFAAGHLINKRDVMEVFKGQFHLDAKGEDFAAESQAFFDAIATAAFVGDVAAEFSKYETANTKARWLGIHPNINNAERFSALLQGIHKEEPDLLGSAVAKGVHDRLNTHPGGLPVENEMKDKWTLSGDNTMNSATLEIARRAVAQSQQNVIGAFMSAANLDYSALYKRVWDYAPRPTADGRNAATAAVSTGTDAKSTALQKAVVDLIKANYLTIIEQLVKRARLRKA